MNASPIATVNAMAVEIILKSLRPFSGVSVYMGRKKSIIFNLKIRRKKMENTKNDQIRQAVRETYGQVAESNGAGCGCGTSACCGTDDPTG